MENEELNKEFKVLNLTIEKFSLTYGLFLIFEDLMKIIFGTSSYLPYQPRMLLGNIQIADLPYVLYDLLIVIIALLIWGTFYYVIKFTKAGKDDNQGCTRKIRK